MSVRALLAVALLLPLAAPALAAASAPPAFLGPGAIEAAVSRLVARHGESLGPRIRQGVGQAARLWRPEDGDARSFAAFCETHFLADPAALAAAFDRLEAVLEATDGRLHEIRRELTTPLDLDTGPVSGIDRLLVGLDLQAHVDEDLFRSKVAFFALLNFPVHTLAERLAFGSSWDRDAWARSRLLDRFAQRVPAEISREITRANTEADRYIAEYNVRMDRLVAPDGSRPFPEGLRLISHWGLRDELASRYGDPEGLPKQRAIQRVMERIVRQEIPRAVVDNPDLLWCPETNEVRPAPGAAAAAGPEAAVREPDTRYERWLDVFRAVRAADPYAPAAPSHIARRFEIDRQIPAKEAEALLVSVLESAEVKEVAVRIRERLGRPLEPFDVWYPGFTPRGRRAEPELDAIVRAKYPTVSSFQAALPGILASLGFSPDRAAWLAGRIVVDPSRGAGHAMGAVRRGDAAHLRTRVPGGGMDYKGYSIAIHELGHNVEQIFSLDGIDRWALSGVPNNAFTEAFAFVFQDRDLELLGLAPGEEDRAGEALGVLWATYEIGGVALVDMKAWDWLYAHPDAKPSEFREAVLAIAREVWNRYYAPVLGVRDREILAS